MPPPVQPLFIALAGLAILLGVLCAALYRRSRRFEASRDLLQEGFEATRNNFAMFSPSGNLIAWNGSYADLHSPAFDQLPRPVRYEDLMREAVRQTHPPDEVEAEVARRVRRHFHEPETSFERLYPNGRWMGVTKRRLSGGQVAGFALDITDLKHREFAIAESEARYRALIETASVGIWHLAETGRTIFGNARLAALFGGAVPGSLGESGLEPGPYRRGADPFGFPPGQEVEVAGSRPDGARMHLLVAASGWLGAEGRAEGRERGCVLTLLDISPLKAAQDRAEHLARHDPLTGLGNRAQFADHLALALRRPGGCSLILIDLDHFKAANDRYGHVAGDEVLRVAAARMAACMRGQDVVCRLGGDEFAAILPATAQAEAERIADRLVGELSSPYPFEDATITLSASIGVATAEAEQASADRLIQCADLALYHVKRFGRSGVQCFNAGLEAAMSHRKLMASELERGLAEGEFALHFQPQVTLASGQVECAEALLRWRNGRLGRTVMPSEFLPIAREARLMPGIDAWVLDAALRQMAEWLPHPGAPRTVAINLAAETLSDPGLPEWVEAALRRHGVPPAALEIEAPEDVARGELDAVTATLGAVRTLGVRVSLDDVGTGLTGFAHIAQLPVQRLKLDRSMVAGLSEGGKERLILRAVVSLARDLGLEIVAKGVETADQLSIVRQEGCTVVQGYLTGRPAAPDDLLASLALPRPEPAMCPQDA